MKTSLTASVKIFLVVLALALTATAAAADKSLSSKQLNKLRNGFEMDSHTRAMYNAITNTSIKDLAMNRDIIKGHNKHFTHKAKVKGITNQKAAGTCWLFASLNALRPSVIDDHDLPEFEFSQNYFIFYDKLEKSNTFLQRIIDWRDRDLMDRELTLILKGPCSDGGFWESTKDLIDKYGAVPSDIMPPTNSSAGTSHMNRVLWLKLRSDAAKLRKMNEDGKKINQLIKAKEMMLADVYKILAINLGTPPTEFVWRYETNKAKDTDDEKDADEEEGDDTDDDADDEDENDKEDEKESTENKELTQPKRYTPKSFFKEFADIDLDQYVNIFNDTTHPYGKRYQIKLTRNLYDGHDIDYINTTIDHLKQIAMESIIDGTPLLFAADVSVGQNTDLGIMARDLYDYESIYGIDLSFSKAQRAIYRNSVRNHGMVFIGVDVQNSKPVKWRVENSWGADKGSAGYWTMYTDWFDMNVYNIIVKKKYVPAELLEIRKQKPTVLPAWDPMM